MAPVRIAFRASDKSGVVPTGAAVVAGIPAGALPTGASNAGGATGIAPAEVVVAGVTTSFAVTVPLMARRAVDRSPHLGTSSIGKWPHCPLTRLNHAGSER